MTFVSRAVADGAPSFRATVGCGEFDGGGVDITVAGAPPAFRFFETVGATPGVPGVDSLGVEPFG